MNHMTTTTQKILSMVIAAMLGAIGIIIPMFAPKIIIEPASFTLASHVPIIIAMFISPMVAVSVGLITTLGFFISGFPLVVVLRALTHVVFAIAGAFLLKKNRNILNSVKGSILFALLIAVIHAVCEVTVVTIYYWGGSIPQYTQKGYLISVIVLVGVGTIIHSCIDFSIALLVWKPLQHIVKIPISAGIKANR